MDTRYSRNIPALNEQECETLRTKKVAVIGCGGLGGYLIELLTRLGIGQIIAVDGDVFDETNLNRQLLSEVSLLGTPKAEAAAARAAQINPDVAVTPVCTLLDEGNAHDLLRGCDAVLDALDNIPSRRILARACEQAGIPYIYGAISGWVAQAAVSMPGDRLIERLYPEGVEVRDKSVLSFTPALCASVQAALCVSLLTGKPVETGHILYFDLLNLDFESIPMAL